MRILLCTLSLAGCCLGAGLVLGGCSDPQQLTQTPLSLDVYVDSTFSNDQVARECLPDIMTAASTTAASRGFFELHTFDGDPFRRRGLSMSFNGDLPRDIQGTAYELSHLEEQADDLKPEIEGLIDEPPVVGGTPLVDLLRRAARNRLRDGTTHRLLVCTDGLFTDLDPKGVSVGQARRAGTAIGENLRGATVDFIGLDASAPGRGRYVEAIRPRVEAVLAAAGMKVGVWGVGLGSRWRADVVDEVNGDKQ